MRRLSWIMMGLLLVCLLAQPLALVAISGYQQFISPHKGWHCAYAALHKDPSCSAYGKEVISWHGIIAGASLLWERFDQCREAALTIRVKSGTDPCDQACEEACYEPCGKAWDDFWAKFKKKADEAVEEKKREIEEALDDLRDKLTGQDAPKPGDRADYAPTDDEIKWAIQWALSMKDKVYEPILDKAGKVQLDVGPDATKKPRNERNFYGLCQAFVANTYRKQFQSALSAADAARLLGAKDDGEAPPRGSWVYYTMARNPNGHAALSIGGGKVVHVSTNTQKKVARVKVDGYNTVAGTSGYVGWAWPKHKTRGR